MSKAGAEVTGVDAGCQSFWILAKYATNIENTRREIVLPQGFDINFKGWNWNQFQDLKDNHPSIYEQIIHFPGFQDTMWGTYYELDGEEVDPIEDMGQEA